MKTKLLYILVFLPFTVFSQLGGSGIYNFVTVPTGAKENALGGSLISLYDEDVSLTLKNPSLLDSTYSGEFSGTWGSYHITETNIGFGSFAYAHSCNKLTLLGGIHFFSYGRFFGYDEAGNFEGTFFASDYEIIIGGAYQIYPKISAGINVKPIMSYYETYSSYGLLSDIAVSYKDSSQLLTTSLVLSNVGWQLTSYTPNNKENIPFSIDLGITKKLNHAPLRLSLTYQGINNFDLWYEQKLNQRNTLLNEDNSSNEPEPFKKFSTNLVNHINISTEILLFKSLHLLAGYNFRKAYEMSVGDSKKGVGISLGFNLKLSHFSLSYGWAKQHVAGGINYFTFTTNVDKLFSQFTKK